MPCSDSKYWADALLPKEPDLSKKIAFLEAALCAALTVNDRWGWMWDADILNDIDYDEAGINKQELIDWWENHKKNDAIRRKKEAKEKAMKKQNLRENALRKLTQEEREALGL